MPNIIRPEERPPYPWTMVRVLLRCLGIVSLVGAVAQVLGLLEFPWLAWFARPPLDHPDWSAPLFAVHSLLLALGGLGLLILRPWSRWLMFALGVYTLALSGYALIYNSLIRAVDWVWAGAAIGGILLLYSMSIPFAPAFAPRPGDDSVD